MIELRCAHNKLTALDLSKNTALKYLYCRENRLTSLDVSKNIELRELSSDGNQLITLDVSKNTGLRYLDCPKNQLTALTLSSNLTELTNINVYKNKLKINAMNVLVSNLPNRTGKDQGQIWMRFGAADENEVTGNHVALTNSKNWRLVSN